MDARLDVHAPLVAVSVDVGVIIGHRGDAEMRL